MATFAYLRVSTTEQTTDLQRMKITERYAIDEWFEDLATSGSVNTCEREGWARMMDVLKEGDTVVAYSIDRLGRNAVDVMGVVEALADRDVALITLREGLDLGSMMGKAMLGIMAVFAQMERDVIRERVKAGMAAAKGQGKHRGRPSIDVAEQVKALTMEGKSVKDIAQLLGVSTATVSRNRRK